MSIFKPLLFLFTCAAASVSFCQNDQNFRRLGVNDGLSQNSVREIFQDEQGFIWIGTGDGLNRYDGRQIKKHRESFRDKTAKRFPGKIINGKIIQDHQQNLWMIVDGQIVKMNLVTETFSVIRKIGRDLEGRILGLFKNEIIVSIPGSIVIINVNTSAAKRIDISNVFGIYTPDPSDLYLLFQKDNGLYTYHIKSKAVDFLLSTGSKKLSAPIVYNNSSILFALENEIREFNLSTGQVTAAYKTPNDKRFHRQLTPLGKTAASKGSIIALAPDRGVVLIDSASGTFHHYTNIENDPLSLSSNLIYTSVIDHVNNLWLGTEGGGISILNLKPNLFNAFPAEAIANRESSLLMVKSIYHKNGEIYVGTYSRGLYRINRFSGEHQLIFDPAKTPGIAFHGIYFIKEDDKGRVWMNIGDEIGITDIDNAKFTTSTRIAYMRKGKSQNILQCFAQISPHKYMAGTFQSTYIIDEANGKLSVTDLGLINKQFEDDIQSLFVKDNGDIIVGKGEGKGYLTVRVDETNNARIIEQGLNGLTIKQVRRDNLRKAFWYATNVGIIIKRDSSDALQVIDEKDGLSNDFIYAIVPEDDHRFWISTNKGLNKVTLKKDTAITVSEVEQYGIQHGLQSNEFNTGAYFKDGHTIFFGGVTGINWFDERKFFKRTFVSRSYITDLLINEKPFKTDTAINFLKKIKLNYDDNNIFIKFATLDYTAPNVNQYLYRLKGYEDRWITAYNIPEARYSKIPPGRYIFEIKSANSEGIWSASQPLLTITITPPFWRTWWFKIIAIVLLSGLVLSGFKYYLKRRLEKQRRIIEKQLAVNNERLRISRDMHDELGTGLSKIALLSELGKNSGTQEGGSKIINEISATSRGLADKMGEIIWTLNPHNDTLGNLAAYLNEYISETTEPLSIEVAFNFPAIIPDISLGHRHRQQLMLVTKEALNNALKYAEATKITFSLFADDRQIVFSLKDNGKGFDADSIIHPKNGKRNGLGNIKARMESINGSLRLTTSKGTGTEVSYGISI
ncbi:ligand-binding sensor domain-containing protein [Niabella aquatica]